MRLNVAPAWCKSSGEARRGEKKKILTCLLHRLKRLASLSSFPVDPPQSKLNAIVHIFSESSFLKKRRQGADILGGVGNEKSRRDAILATAFYLNATRRKHDVINEDFETALADGIFTYLD